MQGSVFHTKEFGKIGPGLKLSCNKLEKTNEITPMMNIIRIKKKLMRTLLAGALFFMANVVAYAQDSIVVKGIIVSGSNHPIENISVSVEGSFDYPVVTNEAGEFTIKVTSGDSWLIISPASDYKKKRLFLNNRTELRIYLTQNDLASGDDEVTLMAQRLTRRDIPSAHSGLNTRELIKTPVLSIEQFLQGRVAGMHSVNMSGHPGSGAVGLIRGVNSVNASNQPLYVVDGIPMESAGIFGSSLDGFSYNPLLVVNPLDVSSILVVRDAPVLAAYGSKASNGLVAIETLDPSATKTSIEVDLRGGLSLAPSNLIPQMTGAEHKTFANEVLFTSGRTEEALRELYPSLFLTPKDDEYINYQHNTNWQELIFSNAYMQNFNVKVKGGDAIARYGLSFGYVSSDGVIKSTNYEGYNIRFVSKLNIFTWLKMNANVAVNYSYGSLRESAGVKETNPILTSLAKSPLSNPYQYDINGKPLSLLSEVDPGGYGVSNPVAINDNYSAFNKNYHFISAIGLEATLKRNLVLFSNFGINYNALKEEIFMPNHGMEHYYNGEAYNVAKASNNYLSSFYNNTYLSYSKSFNKVHHLSSNTGVNVMLNKFQYDWGMGMNAHENDQYRNLNDGQNNLRQNGGDNRNWNWISIYENLNYQYKDRYIAMASLSFDGSSRVGRDAINTVKLGNNPFGLFYSVGLGWRVSNENFMKNISWIDELKLRTAYGRTGNDDIGEMNALNYYSAVRYRETQGLYPAVLPNTSLSYEVLNQLNAGIDFASWGNRLRASFDVFQSTTSNMLIYTPLEVYTGYEFRPENGGTMKNVGYEANAFIRLVEGKKFRWDLQANIAHVSNEITQIKGNKLVTPIVGGEIVKTVGGAANSFYGYLYEGVFATAEQANKANISNDKGVKFGAGDAIFKDISGPTGSADGIINEYDKTIIGSSMPEYYGGLMNTFTYGNWSLNAMLQLVSGNEVFNYVRYMNERMTGLENQSAAVLKRWQTEGQETMIPRAAWNDPIGNSAFSSRWIEDGSFIRVKHINLTYTIPHEFLAFQNAIFYISANNIFTFSKYLGYDPEYSYSQLHMYQGVDYGQTPQPRQFIIGVRLGL